MKDLAPDVIEVFEHFVNTKLVKVVFVNNPKLSNDERESVEYGENT
jgi:hypothetical protein